MELPALDPDKVFSWGAVVAIGTAFGCPKVNWASHDSLVLDSTQDALDELAQKHLEQGNDALREFNKENPRMSFTQFFECRSNQMIPSTIMSQKIAEITQEKVYCSKSFSYSGERYGFKFPMMFYKLEQSLLEIFPYLEKFPKWNALFEQVGDSNCYLMKEDMNEFIINKSAEYKIERSMH